MVVLDTATYSELSKLLSLAFDDDHALLSRYHISPGSLHHCVQHTLSAILENMAHYGDRMHLYSVKFEGVVIGYTITIEDDLLPSELYSFGINIHSRKKEILLQWISCIKARLSKNFYSVLWSKNTRAINFFEKNDFGIVRTNKNLPPDKTLILCRQGV